MGNQEIEASTPETLVLQWEKNPNQLTRRELLDLTFKAAGLALISGTVASFLKNILQRIWKRGLESCNLNNLKELYQKKVTTQL